MTMLCLDRQVENRVERDLHDWLQGECGLLFSHPQDFDDRELRDELSARRVRPIAVNRDGGAMAASWIDELPSDAQMVRLKEPPFAAGDPTSFAARVLRGELLAPQSRYALMVDGSLKHRAMLRYQGGRDQVSVQDLIAAIRKSA
jgi:hypothetical protein